MNRGNIGIKKEMESKEKKRVDTKGSEEARM